MGEIRIKNAPEELKAQLKAEAKRLGIDERGVALMRLWGFDKAPYEGSRRDPLKPPDKPKGAASAPNSTPKSPPEVEEGFQLPEWVPRVEWGHYEEMRRKMRKPMTNAAKRTAVETLGKLVEEGWDVKAVLEQSVFNSWQGLFPVKGGKGVVVGIENAGAAVGTQSFDTSGNKALVEAIKGGKVW